MPALNSSRYCPVPRAFVQFLELLCSSSHYCAVSSRYCPDPRAIVQESEVEELDSSSSYWTVARENWIVAPGNWTEVEELDRSLRNWSVAGRTGQYLEELDSSSRNWTVQSVQLLNDDQMSK